MAQFICKTVWKFLTKLNILLAYDSATALSGISPNELNTYIHTKNFTHMFIVALLMIDKIWKQLRCPWIGECTHCGTFDKWILFSVKKEISYQAIKNVIAHYHMSEANL